MLHKYFPHLGVLYLMLTFTVSLSYGRTSILTIESLDGFNYSYALPKSFEGSSLGISDNKQKTNFTSDIEVLIKPLLLI